MNCGPLVGTRDELEAVDQRSHQMNAAARLRIDGGRIRTEAGVIEPRSIADTDATGVSGDLDLDLLGAGAPLGVFENVRARFGRRQFDVVDTHGRHPKDAKNVAAQMSHDRHARVVVRQAEAKGDVHTKDVPRIEGRETQGKPEL